jgi:multiple sugar transport system permease protein
MTGSATTAIAATQAKTPGVWKRNQRAWAPWIFLAPGIAMFSLYVIYPIVASMWLSFYDWDGLGTDLDRMDNYVELFDDEAFYTSLKNNVIWLVLYMLAVPAGLFIALFLNQTVTGIRLYKSLFFFPFVISQVVVGLIFSWFYAPNFGLFYMLIEWLTGTGVAVLADPAT